MATQKKLWIIFVAMVLAGIIGLIWLNQAPTTTKPEVQVNERSYPLKEMGGIVLQLKLYGKPEKTEAAAKAIQQEMLTVCQACNIFNPNSEISQLNKTAAEKPFKCSDLLWSVLMDSKLAYRTSNGAFDISARPLMSLWGFYRKQKKLPSEAEIFAAREKIGLNKVVFDEKNQTVKFTQPGMSLDLGGIAKGFAVRRAAKAAKKCGIRSGLINLGGNMYVFPLPPPNRTAMAIGIRNPVNKTEICGTVDVLCTSIATSGDYERYVVIDGKKFTHIMDIKTGRPVENMLGVTVVTPQPTTSDWLSTAVFIKGEKFARDICREHKKTHVLIIKHPDQQPEKIEVIKIGDVWKNIKL